MITTKPSSRADAYTTHMPIRENLSITMVLSLLLPVFYCVVTERDEGCLLKLYLLGYAMLPFYAVLRRQAWKAASYGSFALTVLLCLLGGLLLSFLLGRIFLPSPLSLVYPVAMGIELLLVSSAAGALRRSSIRRRKAREQEDISWEEKPVMFEVPRFSLFILHVLSYVWGLMLHSQMLCDITLLGAFLYLPLYLSPASRDGLALYLDDRHHVSNIPTRRISRITRALLALVFLCLMLLMSPSFLLREKRPYTDMREWKLNLSYEEAPPMGGGENAMGSLPPEILELLAAGRESREVPKVISAFFYLLFAFCVAFLLRLLFLAFLHHVREFQSPYDEGDLIIPLSKEEEKPLAIRAKKAKEEASSPQLSIRRLYKKTIRRQLKKDPPLPSEMPADLSRRSNLFATSEGKKLHEDYERARYGHEAVR